MGIKNTKEKALEGEKEQPESENNLTSTTPRSIELGKAICENLNRRVLEKLKNQKPHYFSNRTFFEADPNFDSENKKTDQ